MSTQIPTTSKVSKSSQPKDKRTTQKNQKVPRDTIGQITKPAIERLGQRAGIKRSSHDVAPEIRDIMKVCMDDVIRNTLVFTEHARRKTVQRGDLEGALQVCDVYLAAGINPELSKNYSRIRSKPRGKREKKEGAQTHRFRPGTVALRNIRYQQKNSDSLAIPQTNFGRLVREIGFEYMEELRYSHNFMELCQVFVETFLIKILATANRLAIHAHRQTVSAKDVSMAYRIIRGDEL